MWGDLSPAAVVCVALSLVAAVLSWGCTCGERGLVLVWVLVWVLVLVWVCRAERERECGVTCHLQQWRVWL